MISYYNISYHIISYHIISYLSYHIYHIISYHVTSYLILSYHIILRYRNILLYVTLYHIISYHTISHHIILYYIIGKIRLDGVSLKSESQKGTCTSSPVCGTPPLLEEEEYSVFDLQSAIASAFSTFSAFSPVLDRAFGAAPVSPSEIGEE